MMLLCSDGLWSVLPDHVLAQSLHDNTIVRAVPELLASATGIAGRHSATMSLRWR